MNYSPSPNCMAIATKAADGMLTSQQILDAFDEVNRHKAELEASGMSTGAAERVRQFAKQKGEMAKIAAARQKRFAALNIMIRTGIDDHLNTLEGAGMRPAQAVQSLLEGASGRFAGAASGRKSLWSRQKGAANRYQGRLWAKIVSEKPHIQALLFDAGFDDAVTKEMWELRQGGKPGSTGNGDAQWLAKTFADYLELSRIEQNRGGAGIGRMDGYTGVQNHDDLKLIRAGKDRWTGFIMTKLDLKRTFPEGVSDTEAARVLSDIYDTIITGLPNTPTPAEKGQSIGPANLANSLGKHRVLHFRDATAAIEYRNEFGHGGTIAGAFSQLGRAGNVVGLLDTLGPNPEAMFERVVAERARKVKEDPRLSPEEKARQIKELDASSGPLRGAFDIAVGLASRPSGDGRWATIGENIRGTQRMAKLGGATITSVPSDSMTTALASQFRGSGFFKGLTTQLAGIMRGRPRGEQAELAYLGGEGYEGFISQMLGGHVAADSATGLVAKGQELFFRLNGLTATTDISRATNVRMIQAELGMHSGKAYGELYDAYRHVLNLHGIDETRWDVLRQAALRQVNNKPYITPDRVRDLPDSAFEPLVKDRLAAARKAAGSDDADYARRAAEIAENARRSLELDLHAFFADEVSYGVVTPDAATSRWTTWNGQRPGTKAGEMARYLMQFKATPIAFIQRPLARAVYGQLKGPKSLEYWGHIGTGLAALTVAGYMAMTMKDILRGYWPPRNPMDSRTIMASILQSGAVGLYGDFIFSQSNRFGGGILETAAGPVAGSMADLIEAGLDARDYAFTKGEDKFSAARGFSAVYGNVPYANLWFVAPAMQWLWVNSLRERLSPGYLRKQEKDRKRQYGQERMPFLPATTVAETLQR